MFGVEVGGQSKYRKVLALGLTNGAYRMTQMYGVPETHSEALALTRHILDDSQRAINDYLARGGKVTRVQHSKHISHFGEVGVPGLIGGLKRETRYE